MQQQKSKQDNIFLVFYNKNKQTSDDSIVRPTTGSHTTSIKLTG